MVTDKKEYIFAISEEQNITRAARRLYVAQSTLTMYLNRLEEELGMRIFDRSKTPIVPTKAGEIYIEELRKIQALESHMIWRMQQVSNQRRQLHIGLGPVRSSRWSPLLVPRLTECFPNLEIHIHEQGDETLVQSLLENELDLAFGTMPVEYSELHVEELALEKFVIAMPRSFVAGEPQALSGSDYRHPFRTDLKTLHDKPILMPGSENDLYPFTVRALSHYMIQPPITHYISSMRTAASLVAGGVGYLFTSTSLLSSTPKEELDQMCFGCLPGMPDTRVLSAVYREESPRNSMIEDVLQILKENVLPYEEGIFPTE